MAMALMAFLFLSICPVVMGFKSTNIQPSFATGSGGGGENAYQRPRQEGGSSRLSIHLAGEEDNDNASTSASSSSPATIYEGVERRLSAAVTEKAEILVVSGESDDPGASSTTKAATSTVNERLLSEIQASVEKEKYGSNSKRRDVFKEFRSQKTEEERERSIEEARDLNGVNPLVCVSGAAFAWACAGGLWFFTTYLGVLFASHPLETDVYFVQRLTQVFRNVAMGLSSLASGFFGVVGIGIFLLGVRVAYGVVTGELDPTPIKKPKGEEILLPDVWGLMMGKRPNRRGNKSLGGDDNPFGL